MKLYKCFLTYQLEIVFLTCQLLMGLAFLNFFCKNPCNFFFLVYLEACSQSLCNRSRFSQVFTLSYGDFQIQQIRKKFKNVPTCTLKIQGLIRTRSLDIHPLVNFAIVVKKLMKNCYSVPFYIKILTQIFAGIKTIVPLCSFDTSCIMCKNVQIVKI